MKSQLPELVQALLAPAIYPDKTKKVELAQTQMSFVFLTDGYVYKVKKPVNLGYLDYTTLDKRHFFCQQEVALNRRLCPEVYLGVLPITREEGISIGGKGEVLEYAVKMRRLPDDRMMSVLLKQDAVSPEMMNHLAQKLVQFHQKAETSAAISVFGEIDAIRINTEENFNQTEKYLGRIITLKQYQRIKEYTEDMLKAKASLFRERVKGGRIRDCHGDLHAAHICFSDGICIYDCIEFNDRFRYCDVASEIAFLAMDMDHYGRADLSQSFVDAYVAFGRDKELLKLLSFYKCYRAYVRGKVESFKLDDPHISKEEKGGILAVATNYFELAGSYIEI